MSAGHPRRTGSSAVGGARRATGRPLTRAASRPLPAGDRLGGVRPSSRPPGRRSPRPAAGNAVARRPLFTGRAVLLVTLVLLLALTLAGPVRQYVAGRAQLADVAAEGTALQQHIQQLQEQLDRQGDPQWRAREARKRLTYVLPGDRLVVVVDGRTVEGDAGTLRSGAGGRTSRPPWYEGLMESITRADHEERAPAGTAGR